MEYSNVTEVLLAIEHSRGVLLARAWCSTAGQGVSRTRAVEHSRKVANDVKAMKSRGPVDRKDSHSKEVEEPTKVGCFLRHLIVNGEQRALLQGTRPLRGAVCVVSSVVCVFAWEWSCEAYTARE